MLTDHWKILVKTALIGTDRSSNTIVDEPEIQKYLSEDSINPEGKILDAATIITFLKKTGFKPAEFEGKIIAFNEEERLNPAGQKSSSDLKEIIYDRYDLALPEYLMVLIANEKRIADEMLPDVLEACKTKPDHWDLLRQTIGNKGKWLIANNEEWGYLATTPDPYKWATSVLKDRITILQFLRKNDPLKSIDLLKTTWEEDSIQNKVAFLKTFKLGFSKTDEPFLEECLDNRRKEIRKLAARLLAMIPGSGLSERVFGRLENLLSIKRRLGTKTKLVVNLPEKCGQEMIRDGVDPGAQWFKGGVKVSRLGQMIAVTPPKKWESWLDLNAKSTLRVFVRSEWSEMLVQALIEATAFHNDEDWMLALLDFGFKQKEKTRFQNLNFSPLISQITPSVFSSVASKWIASERDLLPEGHLACQILKNSFHPWNDKLTLAITSSLSRWMGFETSRYWNGWHYRSLLKKAAYLSRPDIVSKIEFIWPKNSRIWQSWEKEIIDFLDTLKFRKQLNENILK